MSVVSKLDQIFKKYHLFLTTSRQSRPPHCFSPLLLNTDGLKQVVMISYMISTFQKFMQNRTESMSLSTLRMGRGLFTPIEGYS